MSSFPYRLLCPVLVAVACAAVAAAPARAADLPSRAPAAASPVVGPQWTFTMAAYLWATGLEGRLRTLPPLPAANVDIGFDQVVKNLDGGIMAAGEAQFGRALLFFDLIASKISPDKTFFPAGYPARITVESGSTVALAAAGYRLVDDPGYSIDGFVGVRGFSVNSKLKVQTLPATLVLSESEQWADAVVGARVKVNFNELFYATVMGFAGGGGSRYEWDVFGGLGYNFTKSVSGFAGYRAMKVDYRNGPFVFDALQHGPTFGIVSRF